MSDEEENYLDYLLVQDDTDNFEIDTDEQWEPAQEYMFDIIN